jgi:hypothetical protein
MYLYNEMRYLSLSLAAITRQEMRIGVRNFVPSYKMNAGYAMPNIVEIFPRNQVVSYTKCHAFPVAG